MVVISHATETTTTPATTKSKYEQKRRKMKDEVYRKLHVNININMTASLNCIPDESSVRFLISFVSVELELLHKVVWNCKAYRWSFSVKEEWKSLETHTFTKPHHYMMGRRQMHVPNIMTELDHEFLVVLSESDWRWIFKSRKDVMDVWWVGGIWGSMWC